MDPYTPRAIWSKQKQKAGVLPFIPPPSAAVFQNDINPARAHYAALTSGSLKKPAFRPHPFDFMPRKRRNVATSSNKDDPSHRATPTSCGETGATSSPSTSASSTEVDTLPFTSTGTTPEGDAEDEDDGDVTRCSASQEVQVRMRTEDDALSVIDGGGGGVGVDMMEAATPSESLHGVDKWLAMGREDDDDDGSDSVAPDDESMVPLSEINDADLLQIDDADLLQLDDAELDQMLTEPEDNAEVSQSSRVEAAAEVSQSSRVEAAVDLSKSSPVEAAVDLSKSSRVEAAAEFSKSSRSVSESSNSHKNFAAASTDPAVSSSNSRPMSCSSSSTSHKSSVAHAVAESVPSRSSIPSSTKMCNSKFLPLTARSDENVRAASVSGADFLRIDEIASLCGEERKTEEKDHAEDAPSFAPAVVTSIDRACADILKEVGTSHEESDEDSDDDFGGMDHGGFGAGPEPGALKRFLSMCHEMDTLANVGDGDDMFSDGVVAGDEPSAEKDSDRQSELLHSNSSHEAVSREADSGIALSSSSTATLTPDALALLDAQTGATTRASLFRDKYIAEKEAEVNSAKQKEVVQSFFGAARSRKRKAAEEPLLLSTVVKENLKKARREESSSPPIEKEEKPPKREKLSLATMGSGFLANSQKGRSPLVVPTPTAVGIGVAVAPKPLLEKHTPPCAGSNSSPAPSPAEALATLDFAVAMRGLALWSSILEPDLGVPLEADLLAAPKPPPLPPRPAQAPPLPCPCPNIRSAAPVKVLRKKRRRKGGTKCEPPARKRRKRPALPLVPHDWPPDGPSDLAARKCASDMLCARSTPLPSRANSGPSSESASSDSRTLQNSSAHSSQTIDNGSCGSMLPNGIGSSVLPPAGSGGTVLPPGSSRSVLSTGSSRTMLPTGSSQSVLSTDGSRTVSSRTVLPTDGSRTGNTSSVRHAKGAIHFPLLISTHIPDEVDAKLEMTPSDAVKSLILGPPYRCLKCPIAHPTLESVVQHMARKHVQTVRYGCPDRACTKSFTQMSHVRRHVRAAHKGERRWRCDGCLKRFSENSSRLNHQRLRMAKCVRGAQQREREWAEFLRHAPLVPLCVRRRMNAS